MKETNLKVVSNRPIAKDIYELVLSDEALEDIVCGQFINIGIPNRGDLILKRPFGIAKYDRARRTLTLGYQVVGNGTAALTEVKEGDSVPATYPLGNGFTLTGADKKVMLVGGGIGAFPLLSVPHLHEAKKIYTFLGFRNAESAVYLADFKKFSEELFLASDDGSLGSKCFVTDLVREHVGRIKPDVILACGPMPMFKSLKKALAGHPIPCQVSMEERMGCGIGACLVCVCAAKRNGKVHHERVCADGPVFDLSEVVYDE